MSNSDFTAQAIKSEFLQLLEDKPLREVTVKDLMQKCGLNRNTFYYHFQDIPDLIEQIITEQADQLIAAHPTVDSFDACLQTAFDFALQNRTIVLHIYNSANRSIFERRLWKICHTTVDKYIRTVTADQNLPEQDLELTISFLKFATFGFVIDWINHGMPEDTREKLSYFNQVIKKQPPLLNI